MDMTQTRHQLDVSDQIKVDQSGDQPVLHIGDYQFVLPTERNQLDKVKSQFRQAWNDLDGIDSTQFGGQSR